MLNSRNRQGVAIVEMAVTLPVLVLIVLGTIEASSMIFISQSCEIAAYEGARIAIVPGSTSGNVESGCLAILNARNVDSASVVVTPADFETHPYGTPIRVAVTADCAANALFSPWFYVGRSATADVTMMKEY